VGDVRTPAPVRLFCGIIAATVEDRSRAVEALRAAFGDVEAEGGPWLFDDTDYYEDEMGPRLQRWFVAFREPVDPGQLAAIKLRTNAMEQAMAATEAGAVKRRVNLDPGYLDAAKLVLATTKDFAHRLYLRDGIYAEVTLAFRKGRGVPQEWTYPDFRSGRYDPFFLELRRAWLER